MNRFILATGLATALAVAATAPRAGAAGQTEAPAAAGQETAPGIAVPGPARVEVAFVLDTTGSMGGLIDGAKKKIWAIADEIRKAHPNAEVRIGLVGYRDRGDAYVTTKTELSSDIHAVYGQLIQFRAQGGGDWPESVNEALHVAVTGMGWTKTPDTRRIVFLVGDAPPHMDYVQDIPFTDTLKLAEGADIIVNAVQAGGAQDTAAIWRTIAQLGRGKYIPIPQTGGVVVIETPYDQTILELQIELNRTVIPYGTETIQRQVRSKVELNVTAPAPASADIASYASRAPKAAERKVVTGEGDLVADLATGRADLGKVKVAELPPELRALPEAERKALIEKRLAERKRLQDEMAKLVARRDAHIADAKAKKTGPRDGFDEAVAGLIREQVR